MRVIHTSGTPRARGEAVGVALRSEIETSVSFTMAWAADLGADRRQVETILVPYDDATERFAPDLAEVLDGMARGSGVDPVALRATNAFEELYAVLDPSAMGAPVERCTDALLAGADGPILVHQEQWYAADADSVAIVVDRPDDGITVVAPVVASGLPLVGMNATGTSVGAMSLTATDERPGVPRMIVARRGLDARDREEAWRIVTTPERAGGYSYSFAFADGATALFETTATTAADLRETVHANHAIDDTVASVCPSATDGSISRLARMTELAAERDTWTIAEACSLLADHGADGQNICVHPDPTEGPESSAIMFGMVADVANRTLWVAPQNPCRNRFERFALDELIA
jgi:isopenicillin-N N-acyltransferase like protein